MLGPALRAIRSFVEANYTGPLLMRWQNEDWEDTNPQKKGDPFIEVEIIGGMNEIIGFSKPGNRLWKHPGIIRFYIFAPWNTGMEDAWDTSDALGEFMQRTEFGNTPSGQMVRTLDFSTYDNIALDEAGNYSVLMASVPFDFYYTA